MNSNDWIQITAIGTSLLGGGFLGYFVKYYLDKKQQFATKNAEFKREAYSEVISLLTDVMSQGNRGSLPEGDLPKRLDSAYSKCILYASPQVISAFGDTMQYLFIEEKPEPKIIMLSITKIFKCMREDIGLSNESLGDNAERVMRVRLNDYKETMEG
jgi:hypothetical protein